MVIIYLLQQRALEELNTFVKTLASTPRLWPRENASDTPTMLIAIARLLHILATWKRKKTEAVLRPDFVNYYFYSWSSPCIYFNFLFLFYGIGVAKLALLNIPIHCRARHSISSFFPLQEVMALQRCMPLPNHQPINSCIT